MKLKLLIAMFFCLQSIQASAQELTSENYVLADVAAREATLDGMRIQIELLTLGASEGQLHLVAVVNQNKVEDIFFGFSTTGSQHTAYGTKYREEIETWLNAHTDWQITYQELGAEFNSLSQQIATLREGQ